jgi:hypothetical protein
MLKLIVFLDQHLSDWGVPDNRNEDSAGMRWWFEVLFFLLFSALGGYVFAHLLRLR